MTTPNTLRRLNWLWKHRHTHDGDTTQNQIQVIRTIVEEQADDISAGGSGAYIHLQSSGQTVTSTPTAVSWTGLNGLLGLFHFATPSFPVTEVTVEKPGYYDVGVMVGFASAASGAAVSVVRVRDSEITVFPPGVEAGVWTVDHQTKTFSDVAKGIEFLFGDRVKVYVSAGSSVGLSFATLDFELIDRLGRAHQPEAAWELVFAADNYGVAWDGSNWWTSDNTDNVNPALFKRASVGTILDSYAGWDTESPSRSRGLVYADSFLWGTGNDSEIHKIDPSTGSSVSNFTGGGKAHALGGMAYNGTNLFVSRQGPRTIGEYSTSGTLQGTFDHPTGRTLRGLAWNGTGFWATSRTSPEVFLLDASFNELSAIDGPGDGFGCHYRDGFLYVMTANGLYRRIL